MKFGIREVCDMDFYKYGENGTTTFAFRIDSAKTSTLEGAATVVYAQGGKGNSRLMAWEGERTITFTVEDALFSKESLAALLGTTPDANGVIKITDKDFAGMYRIEASTLIRDENNVDKAAIITIHKAKLQSNFNIAMAPTGDPSAFTFTFDAFPVNDEFLTIQCDHFKTGATASTMTSIVVIDGATGARYSANKTGADDVTIEHAGTAIEFGGTAIAGLTTKATDDLVAGMTILSNGQTCSVPAGSTTTWYIVS